MQCTIIIIKTRCCIMVLFFLCGIPQSFASNEKFGYSGFKLPQISTRQCLPFYYGEGCFRRGEQFIPVPGNRQTKINFLIFDSIKQFSSLRFWLLKSDVRWRMRNPPNVLLKLPLFNITCFNALINKEIGYFWIIYYANDLYLEMLYMKFKYKKILFWKTNSRGILNSLFQILHVTKLISNIHTFIKMGPNNAFIWSTSNVKSIMVQWAIDFESGIVHFENNLLKINSEI